MKQHNDLTDKKRILAMVKDSDFAFRPDFARWIDVNFAIWKEFERRALLMGEMGRVRFSARTITESIRWDTALREAGGTFKINDHYPPDMARLFMLLHPSYAELFELRHRSAAKPAALRTAV